jgi:hypothetical protein
MDTQTLLVKLTSAISYRYRDDKTAPGLTVSALKKGYYCSVVRYQDAFGKGKIVVCKAKGDSLQNVLVDLTQEFLAIPDASVDPVQELRNSFTKSNIPDVE